MFRSPSPFPPPQGDEKSALPLPVGEGWGEGKYIVIRQKRFCMSIAMAKTLRKKQTPQEIKMWARLRNRQFHDLKFRRQCVIDIYVVDFLCVERKLIIEIDGWQHREEFSGEKEVQRTRFLEEKGYCIVRFWNNEIDQNIDGVFLRLEELVEKLT